ncbi:MAG: PAS domain S-box protein, partial [Acidobacteria bacterium]|nr:PAS domain S-box protein [Acidobacteriota bacterium]MCW5969524.1 PAS domain S-box protein [Blastocatellales bacterium]
MKSGAGTSRVSTRVLLLLFLTVLAVIGGAFNLRDRWVQKAVPTDGVVWGDRGGLGVVAEVVESGGPASRAGVRRGDILIGISTTGREPFEEISEAQHVQLYLDQAKDWLRDGRTLSYLIVRMNDARDTVISEGIADLDHLTYRDAHTGRGLYLALIGAIYLGIGVYVVLKQGRAPYVAHFFVICLLAFLVHSYSPTQELRTQFDKAVDLTETIALILLAPVFLHFSAIYPARYHLFNRRRWLAGLLYLPAAVLIVLEVVLHFAPLRTALPWSAVNLRSTLDRIEIASFGAAMLGSCALLLRTFLNARSVVVRQQLKWVIWGLGTAGVAFTLFYLPSYLAAESVSGMLEAAAIAPFVFIPLTLGYSIVRYRLMDVDVVVRRSAAYIIATLSVAVLFGSVMAGSYEFLRQYLLLSAEATVLIAAVFMSAIAMLFAPMKNWVQERIDRFFYGEKYDYRVTLQDFGRALSSTTELDVLLDRLVRRLKEVLAVDRLAIFVEDKATASGFRPARTEGVDCEVELPADFLSILREHSGATGIVRTEAIEGDEGDEGNYDFGALRRQFICFAPCAVRSRVVAVIALGRSPGGAPLSSEDIRLLRSISGYVAVAVENALLLREQAQRAKELERLKEFNENIIESITVGVMVVNLHGRIVNWNGALEAIYGLRRQDVIGRRVVEVFDAELLRAWREMMTRSEQNSTPTSIYKFRARARDGRELILNLSLAALHSKTGEVEGTLIAIEDLTERVRLESQLQQSDKLSSIGLLAAGVAHEVNTPLTGISSYAQMLMQQVPETDPRHMLLQKIHRQTSRASAIVNNLLNFSRVSDALLVPVDLHRVLDDTVQLLEAQLRNTQIEVVRTFEDDVPLVPGNAAKLQQVFMNLILNARDAMTGGGRLEISTEGADNAVVVRFRDSGVGIAPENLARIYDPFFTTKQIGQGTGLGLAVSYGIIQDHGGRIAVESRPGDGACFIITLPTAVSRAQLANAGD